MSQKSDTGSQESKELPVPGDQAAPTALLLDLLLRNPVPGLAVLLLLWIFQWFETRQIAPAVQDFGDRFEQLSESMGDIRRDVAVLRESSASYGAIVTMLGDQIKSLEVRMLAIEKR